MSALVSGVASPPASAPLRTATGGAAALAVLAALLSGVPPWPACAVLLVLLAVAAVPAVASRVAPVVRRAAPVLLIASVVVAAQLLSDGLGSPGALAVLACATVVGHHLGVRTHRDVVVSVLATGGTTVLVLSQDGSWAAWPAVAGAWAAGVAALALRASERRGPVGTRPPAWQQPLRRLVWPLLASVVTVLVLGLLGVQPPSTTEPSADGGASGPGSAAPGALGGGGTASRAPSTYALGYVDMRTRGDLPRTPVARVPAASDRLWRAQVLGGYDGAVWYPVPTVPVDVAADDRLGLGDRADGAPDGPLRTDDVELVADLGGVLLLPGHAVDVRATDDGVGTAVAAQALVGRTRAYEVESVAVPPATASGPAGGVGRLPDDPGDGLWTGLPPSVTDRTLALAEELTRDAGSRAEAVAAVEAHLRGTYDYDLDSPVPPAGQDAVDHFLFDARAGFCEHFAAAEVVLLRAAGIPARMATGFSGGEDEGATRLVRGDRAHAWVEVWQPGTGWAPSDPTPADDGPGAAEQVSAALDDADVRRLLAALLVLAFVVAAAVAAVLGARRSQLARVVGTPAAPAPLLAAAERLLVALERSGRPSPPGETVASVAARLPEVAGELALVERAAYAARPPGGRESLDAVQALDRVSSRLLVEAKQAREAAGRVRR